MYYLLEKNRIVCNEELIKRYKGNLRNLEIEIKRNELQLIYINDRDIRYIIANVGKIKKQSENVYDFIEKEDLIKIKMVDTFSILEVCRINGGASGMKHIFAIYKPDANGNYIKVWEKEDGRNN